MSAYRSSLRKRRRSSMVFGPNLLPHLLITAAAASALVLIVAGSASPAATRATATVRQETATRVNITGTWKGTNDNSTYLIRQTGSKVTWWAHSEDNADWCHSFSGTVSGKTVVGKFTDSASCSHRSAGRISLTILDATHMKLTYSSVGFGTQTWQRVNSNPPPPKTTANYDLTGTWRGTNDSSTYVIKQRGTEVTWWAHSEDNKHWCHNFTGTISRNVVEGDFVDSASCSNRLTGHIKLLVVDANHMKLTSSSVGFGTQAWER